MPLPEDHYSARRRRPRRMAAATSLIVIVWAATHLLTLNWGLPNPRSFAPDAVDPYLDHTPYRLMEDLCFKYPPLQFLVVGALLSNQSEDNLDFSALMAKRTDRIWRMRLITAVMTLATSLALAAFAAALLKSTMSAVLAAVLFLTNPASLYYSHTANMDQPFVFWWVLSWIALTKGFWLWGEGRRRSAIAAHATCGVFIGCAFCTKDPVIFMYPVPLLIALTWLWRRGRGKGAFLLPPLSWGIGFLTTTTLIYALAGGWNVLKSHFVWIGSSPTTIGDFRQYGSGVFDRLALAVQSVGDLAACLDFPLTLAVFFTGVILFRSRGSDLLKGTRRRLLTVAVLIGAGFVSHQLLFTQVVRFSFPRYYLAFLPFACLFVGGIWPLLARHRLRLHRTPAILVGILAVLVGVQQLVILQGDSRRRLRSFLGSEVGRFGDSALVGTISSTFGEVYLFADGGHEAYRAVRNWGLARFGFLAERQKSMLLNPYSVSMLSPSFLVCQANLTREERQLLARNSYRRVATIAPPSPWIRSWFSKASPVIDVYALNSSTPCRDPEVDAWLRETPFSDVVLVTQACVDQRQIERQADIVGESFPDFQPPDLARNYCAPLIFRFIAQAYEEAGRLEQAAKTHAFIMDNFSTHGELINVSRLFFAKRPELAPDEAKR